MQHLFENSKHVLCVGVNPLYDLDGMSFTYTCMNAIEHMNFAYTSDILQKTFKEWQRGPGYGRIKKLSGVKKIHYKEIPKTVSWGITYAQNYPLKLKDKADPRFKEWEMISDLPNLVVCKKIILGSWFLINDEDHKFMNKLEGLPDVV